MRTFKIYSLSNFQICNPVLLTTVTTLDVISPELITGSLYLWPPSPICPPFPYTFPFPLQSLTSFHTSLQAVSPLFFHCCIVFRCVEHHDLFTSPPADALLGCFQFSVIANNAAMHNFINMPFCMCAIISEGYIPRRIARSKSRCTWNFTRYFQAALHGVVSPLHFHPRYMSIPFFFF